MSSAYQSMIDAALRNARAMASTGVEKTASVETNDFYKEASELANALEYMAISSVDDGTAAGVAQSDMIKDFFKQASKQRMGVPHGSTAATGTQGVAPSQGKLRLNGTQNALHVTSGPDTRGNAMLESYKQASLYDILMGKQAQDSPPQYTADQYSDVTNANENSVRRVLDTNESVANFNRRHVHGENIRARLAEAFDHTNDSLSDATAAQIFPQAYAAGGLKKTASDTRYRLEKQAYGGKLLAGTIGAGVGAAGGAMAGKSGERGKGALIGAGVGALSGAGAMHLGQRAFSKAMPSLEKLQRLEGITPAVAKDLNKITSENPIVALRQAKQVFKKHGLKTPEALKLPSRLAGAAALGGGGSLIAAPMASYFGTRREKRANAGQFLNTIGGRALAGGGLGAAAGGVGGYMAGGDAGSAMTGAALGGLAGAAGAGLMQRANLKNVAAAEKALGGSEQAAAAVANKQQAVKRMEELKKLEGTMKGDVAAYNAEALAGANKHLQQLENLQKAQQAAQGGLGAGAAVAGGAGALAGVGGGMMMGKNASDFSARSRLRQMQRGL